MYRLVAGCSLALALAASALTLPEISTRLAQAPFPDTADFWVVTMVEVMGQRMETRAHVIQAGPTRQWMEMPTGPRRIRMVRDGSRMRVTDLVTGTAQNMSAPQDDLAFVRNPFAGGHWMAPQSQGNGIWHIRDTTQREGQKFQELVFSDGLNRITGMVRVGTNADTTHTSLIWGEIKGRKILSGMDLETHIQGHVSRVSIQYTDWLFPRSLPPSLFKIP